MSKPQNIFICSNCDAQYTKWVGRCLECGKWGTVAETPKSVDPKHAAKSETKYPALETVGLDKIDGKKVERTKTNIDELDRVLGGGLVPGSVILLGGEPGIGKSTLALQLASIISNTLYISGEESVEQIKLRADRLAVQSQSLKLANATHIESIMATIQKSSAPLAIIDSVQTIYSGEVEGEAGNINQVRACTVKLMELAKSTGTIIVLVGQVTKDGNVAGPKTLEHLVDVVLYLEGDKYHIFRLLRAAKNRFGSTDEIGVFSMEAKGLTEVKNPSEAFLSGRGESVPGTTVTCLIEGSRPVLVEVQALVSKTNFGYPQRRASGFDLNRLQVLIGVLSKRAGLPLESYDVFLNVVGGLEASEPAADLAVILALASGLKNKTLPNNIASFGEVGLGGEVRPVSQTEKRLNEIKKMGFDFAVIPLSKTSPKITGLKIAGVKNVTELVEKIVK
ncbi:MAG: DNA repair protein RadA [Patescibacteria group bacterium]